jgi:hypothetical protein
MPTLLVDCPYTHRKFSTGVEATAESMRVLWKARLEVNCPIAIRRTQSMCARLIWMVRCVTPRRILAQAFSPVGGRVSLSTLFRCWPRPCVA